MRKFVFFTDLAAHIAAGVIIGWLAALLVLYTTPAKAEVIGGRPHGCPFRAFCGCALAQHLGFDDRRLWLAWNWARLFPRTSAHSGAVAVRHHHVLLLESQVSPHHWQVWDPNNGHVIRRHVRNIRGFVFVDASGNPARKLDHEIHHQREQGMAAHVRSRWAAQ